MKHKLFTHNKERFIGGMHYLSIMTVLQRKIGTDFNMCEHAALLERICGYYQGVGWDSLAQGELDQKSCEAGMYAKMMRQYEDRYDALIAQVPLKTSEKRHIEMLKDSRVDKKIRENGAANCEEIAVASRADIFEKRGAEIFYALPNKRAKEDEVFAMVTSSD
jgi:hypothetical protein